MVPGTVRKSGSRRNKEAKRLRREILSAEPFFDGIRKAGLPGHGQRGACGEDDAQEADRVHGVAEEKNADDSGRDGFRRGQDGNPAVFFQTDDALIVQQVGNDRGNESKQEASEEDRCSEEICFREGIAAEKEEKGGKEIAPQAHGKDIAAFSGQFPEDGGHSVGDAGADAEEDARKGQLGRGKDAAGDGQKAPGGAAQNGRRFPQGLSFPEQEEGSGGRFSRTALPVMPMRVTASL